MPFFHAILHNLRAIAAKFGVSVIFANDVSLSRLTPFAGAKNDRCLVRDDKFVDCKKAVVYSTPFACSASYIGQTSRCLNGRLLEPKPNVKHKAMQSEVVRRLDACLHSVQWEAAEVLEKEKDDSNRLYKDTLLFTSSSSCVSHPSLSINNDNLRFLGYLGPP